MPQQAESSASPFPAAVQDRTRDALLEIADYNLPTHPSRANHTPRYDPDKIREKMNKIKKKHRSSLRNPDKDWKRHDFKRKFPGLRLKEVRHVRAIEKAHAAHQKKREASGAPVQCSLDGPPPYATPGYGGEAAGDDLQQVSWGVDRVHWKDLTIERFIRDYETPGRPFLLTGVADHWPAFQKWRVENLDYGEYRDIPMKAGEDDDGYSVRVKLKYFLQYMHTQQDDSPLYIFHHLRKTPAKGHNPSAAVPSQKLPYLDEDRNSQSRKPDTSSHGKKDPLSSPGSPLNAETVFRPPPGDPELKRGLLADFAVPPYFRDDLFSLVGERRRPPYRWFLVGPERSGTTMHVDPLGTSAWNALLAGHKRWLLFKPGIPKRLVKREDLKKKGVDGEAVSWFHYVLPKLLHEEYQKPADHPHSLGVTEFIQQPGEIIFLPGGWWHAVLNLDDTVACTQNYASVVSFDKVWRKSRSGRKHMSRRWLGHLQKHYPPLHSRALQLNRLDNWKWKFDPIKEALKHKRRKRSRKLGTPGKTPGGRSRGESGSSDGQSSTSSTGSSASSISSESVPGEAHKSAAP